MTKSILRRSAESPTSSEALEGLESTELSLMLKAAQLRYEHDPVLNQVRVAQLMDLSETAVSRLLRLAEQAGIVRHEVVVPMRDKLETQLRQSELPKLIKNVFVVPAGSRDDAEKNSRNLASAAARYVIEVMKSDRRDQWRIVVSCGLTVTAVMERLLAALLDDPEFRSVVERSPVRVLPTTFWGDDEVSAEFPHTLVTTFAIKARQILNDPRGRKVQAVAPTLPRNFYKAYRTKSARKGFLETHGLDTRLREIKDADIYLVGMGATRDDMYFRLFSQFGDMDAERIAKVFPCEICYIPIDSDGNSHPGISELIVGLTAEDLRKNAKDPHKLVIGLGGGTQKQTAIQPLLQHPVCNTAVIDVLVAREWLDRRSR